MQSFQSVQILLVEDNADDVEITTRALAKSRISNRLNVVRDGQEALDYLRREGDYSGNPDLPRPDLILLDINLPRVNGLEVLQRIRCDKTIGRLPVIMLTASSQEEDIVRSYDAGANSFIQKPVEFEKFVHALEVIGEYWLVIAKLPPKAA